MLNEEVKDSEVPNVEVNGNMEDKTDLNETTSSVKLEKHNEEISKANISTREAYFSALNTWVKNANAAQEAMSLFPYFMLSAFPQIYQPYYNFGLSATPINNSMSNDGNIQSQRSEVETVAAAASPAPAPNTPALGRNDDEPRINLIRFLNTEAQTELINRRGGYEYVMAPFWKRAIAELIDMVILLLIKVIIAFIIMTLFGWDWNFDSSNEAINQAIDKVDLTSFLTISMDIMVFSSNFLMLELGIKLVVCIYEAMWTSYDNGSTPGKAAMNLRVVHCEAIVLLPQEQQQQVPQLGLQVPRQQVKVLIYPAKTPTFIQALLRTAAKNIFMTILFPVCLFMVFFKNNRTSYDVLTKTAVVESNPNAVLVRRGNNH